jgi:uncharacterized protein YqgC (DUF456 family)
MTATWVLALTFALLIGGVVGSIVPGIPGAGLSLAGVLFHWWATGYATPGPIVLVAFVGLAVVAMLVDLFGDAIAAQKSGADNRTVIVAIVGSLALAVVTGPVGILVGVPLSVFLVEFYRNGDRGQALRTALLTTAGMFATRLVQALLTATLLVGFALVILL